MRVVMAVPVVMVAVVMMARCVCGGGGVMRRVVFVCSGDV